MGRVLKYLFYLAVLAALAVVGYALVFDLPAPQEEVSIPIDVADD
ncbi:hypothetical protein [Halovulum sp. GXIMD14793]